MGISAYKTDGRSRTTFASTFGSRTDIGCVREHNEDSLIVKPPLFVVADGITQNIFRHEKSAQLRRLLRLIHRRLDRRGVIVGGDRA